MSDLKCFIGFNLTPVIVRAKFIKLERYFGSILLSLSRCTNRLIQEGAKLDMHAGDILEELDLSIVPDEAKPKRDIIVEAASIGSSAYRCLPKQLILYNRCWHQLGNDRINGTIKQKVCIWQRN
ncbi:hypothetical protein ACFLWJ_01060 [Chloroflexota bacterium]